MYYATNPANFTAGLNATTHTAMLSWNAWSIANQDDLSAYFASFRTPELINPGNSTWASGAAYSYQISAPLTADYLVSTTTYNAGAVHFNTNPTVPDTSPRLLLSVSATGLVTGTLPIVTTPTTYSVYIYVRNMPPGGTPVMMTQGSVSYTLTVQ
jgi:hypothetical protein